MKPALLFIALLCAAVPANSPAQSSSFNQQAGADTFVSSGQPNSNLGALGAMEIAAPTTAQPRTEMALMRFDTSAMESGFDTQYGAGNWLVSSLSLTLVSSFPTAGQQPNNASFNKIAAGGFEFDLLSNNSWSETAITWNNLASILPGTGNNTLTPLGSFYWDAAGESSSVWTLNLDPGLTQEIYSGGLVTLLGQPNTNSTVGYLFNTQNVVPAYLNVTVEATPEPSTIALIGCVAGITAGSRFCRRRPTRVN